MSGRAAPRCALLALPRSGASVVHRLLAPFLGDGLVHIVPGLLEPAREQQAIDDLRRAGVPLIHLRRDDLAAHCLSLVADQALGLPDASAVARWHERLGRGESLPPLDEASIRARVRDAVARQRALERDLRADPRGGLDLRYEALFRCGTGALATVDQVFAHAGLGDRVAHLDDASVLRLLFQGEHYTERLCAVAPALDAARTWIADELNSLR